MRIAVLPRTPLSATLALMLLLILFTAYLGFEVLTRVTAYAVPVAVLLLLVSLLAAGRYLSVTRLFPILGMGLD